MFWSNPRDAALLLRACRNSKYFSQPCKQESKYAKANLIKKIRREEKLQFGNLVETKVEKTRRLKLESKGLIPQNTPGSTVDSELAHMLAQSSESRMNIISFKKAAASNSKILKVDSKKLSTSQLPSDTVPVNSDCDKQKDAHADSVVQDVDSVKSKLTKDELPIKKVETTNQAKSVLLSNDLLKDLLRYPIIENDKSSAIEEIETSKVLMISSRADKSCLKYPSVTKILTATMTEEAKAVLEDWKLRMIQKLGAKGFEVYQAELLGEGKMLHSIIMDRLLQKDYSIPDRIKQAFSSLKGVMDTVNKVQALESHVVHSKLLYRGVVDCVAAYGDELCVIDWKRSDKTKSTISSTYDAPLQLAAYIGALNSDPNYPFQLKKGLVVVAYTSGKPAEVHEITESSLQLYWEMWLKRLQDYHSLNSS